MVLNRKFQGAVSIFLVIILVPIMSVAALFVDAGKVSLSKGLATSAADLTLNTALTDYDTQLKNLYGLFATAQDTEDLFSRLEDYYKTCITSSGVSDDEADTYVEQIMAQLGIVSKSNDVSDILGMQVVDFSVEKLSEANLANAAMLDKEIVEFMKYRSPIETGLSFLSALKGFTTLSKQTKMVEAKQKYYEKQEDVMKSLQKAWENIAKYNGTKIASDPNFLTEVNTNMNDVFINGGTVKDPEWGNTTIIGYGFNSKKVGSPAVIGGLHDNAFKDFYGVDLQTTDGYGFEINVSVNEAVNGAVDDEVRFTYDSPLSTKSDYRNGYSKTNLPTSDDIKGQIQEFLLNYSQAKDYIGAEAGKTDKLTPYDNNPNDPDYPVKYVLRENADALEYARLETHIYTSYQKLKAMVDAADLYDEIIEDWKAEQEKKKQEAAKKKESSTSSSSGSSEGSSSGSSSSGSSQSSDSSDSDDEYVEEEMPDFKTTANIIDDVTYKDGNESHTLREWADSYLPGKFQSEMMKCGSYFKSYRFASDTAAACIANSENYSSIALMEISEFTDGYIKDLTTASDSLKDAIQYLTDAKGEFEPGGELDNAKKNWNTAATDSGVSDTSMAKQNQAEISQVDTYLNAENIGKLITRLTNIKTNVDDMKTKVSGYKYCDKGFSEINTNQLLIDAATEKWKDATLKGLSVKSKALTSEVSAKWPQSFTNGGITDENIKWVTKEGTEADLTRNKLAMYSYLYSHFATLEKAETVEQSTTVQKEDKENGENLYKKIKSTSKSNSDASKQDADGKGAAASVKDKKFSSLKGSASLPSKGTSAKSVPSSEVSTDSDKAAGDASSALGSLFGDDFLNAIKKAATDLRDRIYIADYVMGQLSYDTIEKEYAVNHNDKEPKDGDITTLTKEPINKTSNAAYGAEVEYVIYGKDKLGSNVTAAYASIYGIRFGFNLIYAFATSEIRESALAMAAPISAATLGIIPVPLIQAVIIIGLAVIESGIDLVDISNGKAIPLYKSQKTWHCSVSGLLSEAKALGGKVIKKAAGTLIDEGVNKLSEFLDYTDEQLEAAVKKGTDDITDTVASAYDKAITENANSVIQVVTTYVTDAVEGLRCLDANTTYAEQKQKVIAEVNENIKNYKNSITGSDLASEVKRSAVDAVLNSGAVNTLFNCLEEQLQNASGASVEGTINSLLNGGSTVADAAEGKLDEVTGELQKVIADIRQEIVSKVTGAGTEVNKRIAAAKEDVKKSLNEGSEKFRDTINSKIDEICGNSEIGGNDSSTGIASLFSFAYSDYLKLFVLIGEYLGPETVLLRTADVIQKNMVIASGNEGYSMADAAVYVKLSAKVQSKPMLIGLPLLVELEKNPNDNNQWYTFTINEIRGY